MSAAGPVLSLLFHFHQPHYVDESRGRVLLPWVRLHAVKGYYDVPWALERRPELRLTLNLTPVLLLQLEGYVSGRAHASMTAPLGITTSPESVTVKRRRSSSRS